MTSKSVFRRSSLLGTALLTPMVLTSIDQASAALVIAGEAIVNLQANTLDSASTTWTNASASGDSVGNFSTLGGGNLNVASVGTVSKALFINSDGNNGLTSASNAPATVLGNGIRSAEAWVYSSDLGANGGNQSVVSWGDNAGASESRFTYGSGGGGMFNGWNADSPWNSTLPTDEWVHLAWTYDGTDVRGYINGSLINTYTPSSGLTTIASPVNIGIALESNRDQFSGYIGDVRVHTGLLGDADVLNNFDEDKVAYGVPEPSVTILGGLGLLGLLRRRRE